MNKRQSKGDQVWSIEVHGINPITDDERHGRPLELFWIWFAANVGILGIVYGAILFDSGLNLWQCALVTLIGTIGSFIAVGLLSIAGVWGGSPMLTLSRASFGPRGNIAPTLISWISLVGWETVLVVTSAYALLGLLNLAGLPSNALWTIVSLVIVAALVVLFGLLGHATLVWLQRLATWLFGLLTLVIAIFLLEKTQWLHILSAPGGSWNTGILSSFSLIAAGTGIGWINSGADFSRYLPRHSSSKAIIGWTIFGGTLPLFVLILIGFLLSSNLTHLSTASNPIQRIGTALPSWMTIPYLVTAIGGIVVAAALNVYSSGLNLLSLGLKIKRYQAVIVDGVLMIAGAIYIMLIANNFLGPFESFLSLLADGLTAWAAIFLVDMYKRRGYDQSALADTSHMSYYYYTGGVNWIGLLAWLAGFLLNLSFTASPLFNGLFATNIIATDGLGFVLGSMLSAALYALFMRIGRHTQQPVLSADISETSGISSGD
ncbi:MAG TPA: cytosine permease [Ktedonobacteraceae bacterium]|jgi:purine-cytosine permease-like protein|nr:cytosine permease [Ktedonobacteraceae bacterium]